MTVLWHGDRPVGICVFTVPPLSLAQRNRFFRRTGRWSRVSIRAMNARLVHLSRVVLHPSYRGVGIAARFVRASCGAVPYSWVETLAAMGRTHPFFERAGFVRVGPAGRPGGSRAGHSAIYGTPPRRRGGLERTKAGGGEAGREAGGGRSGGGGRLVSAETYEKSRHARPVYFVFDNRAAYDARKRRVEDGRTGPDAPPPTA